MKRKIEIRDACLAHASFVTANMREGDRREVYCQMPDTVKTYEVAYMFLEGPGNAFVAYMDDLPVAFFGAQPLNVCTLGAWAVGTKHMRKVIHAVTRHMIGFYGPAAIAAGYTSMECRTWEEHHEAHRWLESTGAVAASVPFVYGKAGEKFILYRWERDALEKAARRYKVTL